MVFPETVAARIDLGSVKAAELEESIGELEIYEILSASCGMQAASVKGW